jgi:hypothetical protein
MTALHMPDGSACRSRHAAHGDVPGLLALACSVEGATWGTPGTEAPELTVPQTEAVLDLAFRALAARIREGEQVQLPHLGTLSAAPSPHGTARTLIYRADRTLMESLA